MRKIVIKRILSNLLFFSGFYSLVEHICPSNKAFVLTYHRVLPTAQNQPYFVQAGMFVSTTSFEKQISFLKEQFKVVFLEDIVKLKLRGDDIGGLCAITLDDGWRDNYTYAFPILYKYDVPATIFLATGFIGTDRIFWPEELCYFLDSFNITKSVPRETPLALARFVDKIYKYQKFGRERYLDKSIDILKQFPRDEREEILCYFRSLIDKKPAHRLVLNWEEAHEMLASGLVNFGAHTVNHEILDQVSSEVAWNEINQSIEDIHNNLGCSVGAFAYPNGDQNERIRNILAKTGLDLAVTTRKGFLGRDTLPMEIPRIAIHEDISKTIPMFRLRILLS